MEVHGYTETGAIDATIEGERLTVPDVAGNRHRQAIAAWEAEGNVIPAYAAPAPTADDVKAEAYRRIVAIVPEWRQRNLLAQAATLAEKGRSNWTADELAAWNAGEAIWSQIVAIRTASDTIEALDPIPADFASSEVWP